jgi:ABC-2 type transport system ATP-binding protein
VIEVEGIARAYGGVPAVDGVSFSVAPGEILGLLGANGAGKTTTLRILAGILPPDRGRVRIAGHDLAERPLEAKRALAFVPDAPHLFESLTVREHLRFFAALFRIPYEERRAAELLASLELGAEASAPASTLSRGMRQKAALACAILHEPAALLLDEPLTGLDPRGIRRAVDLLRAQAARGAAVIVSSHLLGLVERLCTRILILDRGRVRAHGTLDEIRGLAASPGGLEEVFLELTADRSGP